MSDELRASANKTRRRILKAARQLFVKQGFAATSISQIANKAGINQSLIYHHVGDKEKLWDQVKVDLLSSYYESLRDMLQAETEGKSFIHRYIDLRIDIAVRSPEVQRMIHWQRLEPKSRLSKGARSFAVEDWLKAIEKMQRRNELRQDLSPQLILTLMHSLAAGYADSIDLYEPTEAEIADYKAFASQMLCKALCPLDRGCH